MKQQMKHPALLVIYDHLKVDTVGSHTTGILVDIFIFNKVLRACNLSLIGLPG